MTWMSADIKGIRPEFLEMLDEFITANILTKEEMDCKDEKHTLIGCKEFGYPTNYTRVTTKEYVRHSVLSLRKDGLSDEEAIQIIREILNGTYNGSY